MEGVNDLILQAARGGPTSRPPVWFMRQAGRYQKEYQEIRRRYTLPEIVQNPEACAEVTLLPVKQLGVDAAILFADITTPLYGMGVELDLVEGKGPVIHRPIRDSKGVEALRPLEPEEAVPFVLETIRLLKRELEVPLIGFAGAPFTLASYLIEGGPSRQFKEVKAFMYREEALWHQLLEKLTQAMARYLKAQVEAGADLLQVFDSWVGALSPADYRRYVKPHMARLFQELRPLGVPVIHFGVGTMGLLKEMQEAGGDVMGLDHHTPLPWAREALGQTPIQGNLDPVVLFAPKEVIRREVERILAENAGRPGHIFNLGHGILPGTPVEHVRYVVELLKEKEEAA
ncbi:uroporphyrinogen decarboxylase [Thermus scotoductus]|uniref:Uroporphyrinogen decarboxylase n=1 Tax=Thermus scotoductus TaxID=37636 RepID=A0A430S5T8_THESC|nr:uroporphyrinogen decarboxylase [Thermus scotoductus]RTG96977.1 uroporphyrinogen decarboxylase [Thermus scotoductus]RTH06695.1 uroporphyrinogen decarboxylase [Thermus scotoductus]RTH13342.1 uroporphyrinogen decarboxylase [Thermus scotoductus]RTH14061.1 uroporphyrinogen decarboxylase [Thermus scotoductus]RTH20053.1 uroporphyrinogen decarboxylase [Thermus scotoductus]